MLYCEVDFGEMSEDEFVDVGSAELAEQRLHNECQQVTRRILNQLNHLGA